MIGDPMVGRTIAQYEILARVGGGGMGVVYRARDARLGRTVALKFLPPQWSHDEDARQRFVREAQVASATNHPNICTVHDIETADDGQLFIVMAYYEGRTLKQRIESGPIDVDEALDIAAQIADGLAKAHAQGIVHRDVKPGNIMLTEDGVRILDFGLATFADALKLTIENSTFGTAAYMSPEQVRGQSADARSDVWALGAILYEMLAGHVPFQGSHAEAVAYAIRNEAPAPVRAARPDIAGEVEQLVFRALHKQASVRFASGREMARALRQVRGLSMPLDLRTEPVPVPAPAPAVPARRQTSRSRRRVVAAAATTLALAAVSIAWVFRPIDRVPVAIVPVVNQTGYPELDAFRAGLAHAVSTALSESPTVRVVGHDQLSSILAGVRERGNDVSSGQALQAVKAGTGAQVLVVVTMLNLNDGSGFRARVDFRNADTLTSAGGQFETPSLVSALAKDTAFRLIPTVVDGIEAHFRGSGPRRGVLAHALRSAMGGRRSIATWTSSADAAAAFERGLQEYLNLEYVSAMSSFGAAAGYDALNPLPIAWQSRVARAMRRDADADRLARQAVSVLSEETPSDTRLLTEAVAAESRRETDVAEARYRALADTYADDPERLSELAAFQDRRGMNVEAIATYHRVLAADSRLLRPHLELCRLYNRVNEPVNAREQGQMAASSFRSIGDSGAYAQALFCLTDSLRVGDEAQRAEAVGYATTALDTITRLGFSYNLPRAYNYLALAQEAQDRFDEAAGLWDRALTAAREGGNTAIEPLVLMNLGATYEKLGQRARAIDYLRQSATGFESLGDQARAAENLFNLGAMLIAYGGDASEGLRNVRDALAVFRNVGNRSFEVRAALVLNLHYRYAGRHKEAEQELNRAMNLAKERDLNFGSPLIAVRLAQTRLDAGSYADASNALLGSLADAPARSRLEAQLYLAKTYVLLGNSAAARQTLDTAQQAFADTSDAFLRPLLFLVQGQLALEQGRIGDAREHFRAGGALLQTELPDAIALESRAYEGLVEAASGGGESGRAIVTQSLDIARRIGHLSLQARCRMLLAQIDVARGRFEQALRELSEVPRDDDSGTIERELRAHVHYWSARAWTGLGNTQRASADDAAARAIVRKIADGLPPEERDLFRRRPIIARMYGG